MVQKDSLRKLILTAGYGYSSEDLKIFLRSAKVHTPTTDIVVFTKGASSEFQNETRSFNPKATVVVPPDTSLRSSILKLKWGKRTLGRILTILQKPFPSNVPIGPFKKLNSAMLHPTVARYLWAQTYLENCTLDPDMVMITDSRDVYFQGDPFEEIQNGLVSGAESICIQDCPLNLSWIEQVYSKQLAEQLSPMPIICSGVTMGSTGAIRSYLNALVIEIANNKERIFFRPYLDQAIHNKILRLEKTGTTSVTENGDSLVASLSSSSMKEFYFENPEGLKTLTGKLVKIVHQYDRHDFLLEWSSTQYS